MIQDVTLALRALRQRPLVSAVAVLSLALGIGVNSAARAPAPRWRPRTRRRRMVALGAGLLPARRATRVDPVAALRSE